MVSGYYSIQNFLSCLTQKLNKMARIIGFKECVSHDGNAFNALVIQGGVEVIESGSGKLYATARKTSVATTFDEETCKSLIGTEIPGTIEKQECEPYEYTVEKTGEILVLEHRYTFVPEPKKQQAEMQLLQELDFQDLAGMNYPAAAM